MLTYPWKCTVLHCNHMGNTWKPLVLMTRHFDYCPSASEGDNQSVRSSAPVVSRCFPGGYNVKLYISRGRLAWWLLAFFAQWPLGLYVILTLWLARGANQPPYANCCLLELAALRTAPRETAVFEQRCTFTCIWYFVNIFHSWEKDCSWQKVWQCSIQEEFLLGHGMASMLC